MIFPDLKDEQFEEFLQRLNMRREVKTTIKSPSTRTKELSLPKRKTFEDSEEVVGPGSYNPHLTFLSTKNKSPSIVIGKSSRFLNEKFPKIVSYASTVKQSDCKILNSSEQLTPRYSFKRTGHNLKLVEDFDVPGVGKYTPDLSFKHRAYSFKRSPRVFNWKKNMVNLHQIAEFEKRHWK
jgi:hypothetical protein